jgi:hypothetical protein
MLLKTTNDCKLFVETERCRNPSNLTTITFIREMWDKDKIINTSSYKMHLTDEEILTLIQSL